MKSKSKTKQIKKLHTGKNPKREKPSLYIKTRLDKAMKESAKELSKHLKITETEAKAILEDDETWKEYLKFEEKKWTVKGMKELMPQLHDTAVKKAKTGWTANARDAIIAMNILKEKLIENQIAPINIQGKNVQLNLGWRFKPYNSKSKSIK